MKYTIEIRDVRDEDILTLGFASIECETGHIHCSLDIYKESQYMKNFEFGNVGKYEFQGDRHFQEYAGGCGKCFIGAGRGRKPDKAYEDMKEFIAKADELIQSIKLDEEHLEKVDKWGDRHYYYEVEA